MRSPFLVYLAFFVFVSILGSRPAFAKAPEENRLGLGFGVASPNVGSFMNIATSFTPQNPAGAMYIDGYAASVQIARNAGLNDTGFEGGLANDEFGAAIGFYGPGCDACVSHLAGSVAASIIKKKVHVGLRYAKVDTMPTYSTGALFNASDRHRFGLTVAYTSPIAPKTNTLAYTGGYAFVSKSQSIAVELSKRDDEAAAPESNAEIRASVGYQKRVESLQVSVNYMRTLNSTAPIAPEGFWIGGGFNGETWNLAVYTGYTTQFLAVFSGYF